MAKYGSVFPASAFPLSLSALFGRDRALSRRNRLADNTSLRASFAFIVVVAIVIGFVVLAVLVGFVRLALSLTREGRLITPDHARIRGLLCDCRLAIGRSRL